MPILTDAQWKAFERFEARAFSSLSGDRRMAEHDEQRDTIVALEQENREFKSVSAAIRSLRSNPPTGGGLVALTADGTTLRDTFALQALPGLVTQYDIDFNESPNAADLLASEAYVIADAMLIARRGGE